MADASTGSTAHTRVLMASQPGLVAVCALRHCVCAAHFPVPHLSVSVCAGMEPLFETCTCCQLLSLAGASTVFCLEQWQFCAAVCGAASCAQQLLSAVFHTHSIFTTGKGVVQCVLC
jgi:hypothetical protein